VNVVDGVSGAAAVVARFDFKPQPDLGWGTVAQGGVEIYNVPGSHTTLFWDDNVVQILARKDEECIQSSPPRATGLQAVRLQIFS
jgi:hypothetical protein